MGSCFKMLKICLKWCKTEESRGFKLDFTSPCGHLAHVRAYSAFLGPIPNAILKKAIKDHKGLGVDEAEHGSIINPITGEEA